MSRLVCLEYIQKSLKLLGIEASPNDYLSDLLSAVCLMIEDGLEITFSHRSFQEYFVAVYISSAAPETQIKLIDRFWINMDSDNVMQLLREINSDLFERCLLVPKLEEFFNELGIKKTVGITHLLKYISQTFSTISYDFIDDRGLMFTYRGPNTSLKICQSKLLRIGAFDYGKYRLASEEELDNFSKIMKEQYFQKDIDIETKSLSIKSTLIRDLSQINTWHSVGMLSAAFDAYKKLKAKHTNTSLSFDILLGIK